MGTHLAQQALGLISVLTSTYLQPINSTGNLATSVEERGNEVNPFRYTQEPERSRRDWTHNNCAECGGCSQTSNPDCVWGCSGCKWQCVAVTDNCRYNCDECGWDCTYGSIDWINPIIPTRPPTFPIVPTQPPTVPTFPTRPPTLPTVPTQPPTVPTVPPKVTNATLYALPNFQGDAMSLQLTNIGDCAEFWNPDKTLPDYMRAFNDRGQSIRLPDGMCVRIYENDCGWKYKAKTLDVQPDSLWALRFDSVGMGGVSAVQRTECPLPAEISLYNQRNYFGESVNMTALRKVGDCQELWNPSGYSAMISNELRQFNDKTVSVKVNRIGQTCIRLYENECKQRSGRVFDLIQSNYKAVSDLTTVQFTGIISGVEILQCPVISDIFVYSQPNFQGDSLQLPGLGKPGDCVEFWNPKGYDVPISDDLRRFNDRTRSIKIPGGVCLRIYENNCGSGRYAENVSTGSSVAIDTSSGNMGGVVSSVELTACP